MSQRPDPATLLLVESVIRLAKGMVTALERWLEAKKQAPGPAPHDARP